jgi:hypothetical protein
LSDDLVVEPNDEYSTGGVVVPSTSMDNELTGAPPSNKPKDELSDDSVDPISSGNSTDDDEW